MNALIDSILDLMPNKNPNDYTLIMKLLDDNVSIDFLWFDYNLIIIKRVLAIYIDRVNRWKSDQEQYDGFYILEGDTNFLFEMLFDISSFMCYFLYF